MTDHFRKPARGPTALPRRTFIRGVIAGGGLLAAGGSLSAAGPPTEDSVETRPSFNGRNIVLIRFGGGARRIETIDPHSTYGPFLCRQFAKRGTLFNNMEIAQIEGLNTSHG